MVQIAQKRELGALRIQAKRVQAEVGAGGQRWQVEAYYDVSGSTTDDDKQFYTKVYPGTDMTLMEGLSSRVLAAVMLVDDNKSIPVRSFNMSVQERATLTEANWDGFIAKHFARNTIGGGTSYAPIIRYAMQHAEAGDPILALVFTDGDNGDPDEAERALIEASYYPIFFMFFGIYGTARPPAFTFLNKIDNMGGRLVDNAGFMQLGLTQATDDEIYKGVFKEAAGYPALAQKAGLLDANLKWNGKPAQKQGGLGGLFRR